jgi:phospholipase/lecithinase/hemolysin
MANLRFFSTVLFLTIIMVLLHCESTESAFYLFGDSYLDAGNNNYINTSTLQQANFPPYGESYFKYPTGRFSDGRLVSDFIGEYAKLGLIKPYLEVSGAEKEYLKGVNFASGGAGVLPDTFGGFVINLQTQLNYFKRVESRMRTEMGRDKTKVILSNAVFLFSVATNDYFVLFAPGSALLSSRAQSQYIAQVIGNLTDVVHEIYKLGGRKFAFMNLGPIGCLPEFRRLTATGGCLRPLSRIAKRHNKALAKSLDTIDKQLKDFKYSIYDYHTALTQRIKHPSRYGGLKEGRSACCGSGRGRGMFSCGGTRDGMEEYEVCEDPRKYVFWDSGHLTETVYEQMSVEMWSGDSAIIAPYNLSSLFRSN